MKKNNITAHFDLSLLSHVGRWYLNARVRNLRYPLMAHISATSSCNFQCKTCPKFKAGTLPWELYRGAIDDLGRMGTYFLYLLGGEPLLLRDIHERIAYAKRKIPYVHLVTNGYLLDAAVARRLGETGVDAVSVSIDGLEEINDRFRAPGAFAHAMDALHNLRRHAPGVKAIVATQIAPWNIDDLPPLVRLVQRQGFEQRFQPTIYFPELEAQIEREALVAASDEQLAKIERFVRSMASAGHVTNRSAMLELIPLYYRAINERLDPAAYRSLRLPIFSDICKLPSFYIDIFPDGGVRPCWACDAGNPEHSLHNQRLHTIIRSDAYQRMIRTLESCKKCRDDCMSCYITPQLFFPLDNYLRYMVWPGVRRTAGSWLRGGAR